MIKKLLNNILKLFKEDKMYKPQGSFKEWTIAVCDSVVWLIKPKTEKNQYSERDIEEKVRYASFLMKSK